MNKKYICEKCGKEYFDEKDCCDHENMCDYKFFEIDNNCIDLFVEKLIQLSKNNLIKWNNYMENGILTTFVPWYNSYETKFDIFYIKITNIWWGEQKMDYKIKINEIEYINNDYEKLYNIVWELVEDNKKSINESKKELIKKDINKNLTQIFILKFLNKFKKGAKFK